MHANKSRPRITYSHTHSDSDVPFPVQSPTRLYAVRMGVLIVSLDKHGGNRSPQSG